MAQTGTQAAETSGATSRPGDSFAYANVVVEGRATKLQPRQLLTDLKQSDFRLFDNDQEVSIQKFAGGGEHAVGSIVLWLVVQCHEDSPTLNGSEFMLNKMSMLEPGLRALRPDDLIGVAEWCDDGSEKVDFSPARNIGQALQAAEAVLHEPANVGYDRMGEIAMQELFSDVLTTTASLTPKRLPVFLFLYGDHSATYPAEAESIIKKVLESSGIVFGMLVSDAEANLSVELGDYGQISYLIHRYAKETGGQFYTAKRPELSASAVAYMLTQVHLRYVLGFRPAAFDGKRHSIRIELTKDAKRIHGNPDLHFRTEYVPVQPHN